MNKVILMGRLTRDPEIRYSSGENQTAIARYTLAVDRRFKRQGAWGTSQRCRQSSRRPPEARCGAWWQWPAGWRGAGGIFHGKTPLSLPTVSVFA